MKLCCCLYVYHVCVHVCLCTYKYVCILAHVCVLRIDACNCTMRYHHACMCMHAISGLGPRYLYGRWFQIVAATIYRGAARRAQQIGYAAEHICRSDPCDTSFPHVGRMLWRAQRMPGRDVNAMNQNHLVSRWLSGDYADLTHLVQEMTQFRKGNYRLY